MDIALFPPIPPATVNAARSVLGRSNHFIAIGDQADALFSGLDLEVNSPWFKRSARTLAMYYLITIFQFIETLPDRLAVDALRVRLDWKYALHLPLDYPSLNPKKLCETRQLIYTDTASQEGVQLLINRLAERGLLNGTEIKSLTTHSLLQKICTSSRLLAVMESMNEVLGSLVVTNPEWLRQIALPHWYERYNRKTRLACSQNTDSQLKDSIRNMGQDIHYLIQMAEASGVPSLSDLEEVGYLKQIFNDQFAIPLESSSHINRIHWRPEYCASCRQKW